MRDYAIMHLDRHVATIRGDGSCSVYYPQFMPYNLYLEKEEDLSVRMNNLNNFHYWCATRLITMDRKYAKEILNSLGMKQAVTDRDRAEIAIAYHALCLTDVFWVRELQVSSSRLMTSKNESIVSAEYVNIYAANHGKTLEDIVRKQDLYGFHMMNIVDYLVGNTDRHWGNWGFRVNNADNRLGKLHPLMDFNRAFHAYDTLEGARCLTVRGKISQMEAAVQGVRAVGLNQTKKLPDDLPALFPKLNELTGTRLDQMFSRRLEVLKQAAKSGCRTS